jgi:predicted permease
MSLLDRLRQLPGVQSVTLVENRPGSGWSNNTSAVVNARDPRTFTSAGSNMMRWNGVGPNYFTTIGVPIRAGRDFNDADSENAPKVAVVNETFVKNFLPHRYPLGNTVSFTKRFEFTIVGVVADHAYTTVREPMIPMAYFPIMQIPGLIGGGIYVELRTDLDPEGLLPTIRKQVAAFNPELALLQPRTEAAEFASTIASERLIARLALFFGFIALVLVATGLYGTLAYRVTRRTSELGIRLALGAQRAQILWLVLRESLLIGFIGLCLGLPLALVAGRWLASLLYGLTPHDTLSLVIAVCIIATVILAASLIPARRAASVDPLTALRYE